MFHDQPIVIATRGSALALAQSQSILGACRAAFPSLRFEIKIIKTSGDKLQAVPVSAPGQPAIKGLFTKELEVALLNYEADFAVHSLKDLPTELPEGLTLGAVTRREDVRDVLLYCDASVFHGQPKQTGGNSTGDPSTSLDKRGLNPHATIRDFPTGATIATSSTRRQAQLLALRPDLKVIPIRGNVGTRLRKLAEQPDLDGTVLAAAGLNRLQLRVSHEGKLSAEERTPAPTNVPKGLLASYLSLDEMLPCVGQGAIGIETRLNDERMAAICQRLDDFETHACVAAERAFLRSMGGGCLSPVAAYAETVPEGIRLRAVSFQNETIRKAEVTGRTSDAIALGVELAVRLK